MKKKSIAALALVCASACASPAGAITLKDAAAAISKLTYLDKPIVMKREMTDDKKLACYDAVLDDTIVFSLIGIGCASETADCEGFGLYAFGLKPVSVKAMSRFSDEAVYAKLVLDETDNTSTLIVEQIAEGASLQTLEVQVLALELAELDFVEILKKSGTQIAFKHGAQAHLISPARSLAAKVDQAVVERLAAR